MSAATITGSVRETFGTKASNKARKEGQVPATISRPGQDSLHLLVPEKEAELISKNTTQKFIVSVDGKDCEVLLKEVKRHVLTDRIQHADMIEVNDESEVVVQIPLRPLIKDCPGLKEGGLLEQSLRKVAIRCKVKHIPDHLDVDMSDVKVGQTVYVDRCTLPEGARFMTKPDVAMISILQTRSMKKEGMAAEAGEETAEAPAAE